MEPSAHGGNANPASMVGSDLQQLATPYDFTLLSAVAFSTAAGSTSVDHVLVDRFGVLLITEMACGAASVRGGDADEHWTLTDASGSTATLPNPLLLGRGRERIVRDVLQMANRQLDADYVRSAIVFVEGDLSGLDLGPFERERVVGISGLAEMLRTRHDFAPNPGDVDAQQRSGIVAALRSASSLASAPTSIGPAWVVDHSAAAIADMTASHALRRSLQPSAPESTPRRRRRGPGMHAFGHLALRLMPLAVVSMAYWWVFYGGGMAAIVGKVESISLPEDQAYSVTAADPTTGDKEAEVSGAVKELQQTAPTSIVAGISDVNSPTVSRSANGVTIYTWRYADGKGGIRTYSIRKSASGSVAGPDAQ